MHINVRHDIFYNFSSGVINVENKEKTHFLQPIFVRCLVPHPLMPFDSSPKFCTKLNTSQSCITLKDSSFGSNFRELSIATILNLFWVDFHGILLKMSSIYTNASPVMQLNSAKKLNFSKFSPEVELQQTNTLLETFLKDSSIY